MPDCETPSPAPPLKGRGLTSQHATQQHSFGDDAFVAGIDGDVIPHRPGEGDHAKHGGGARSGYSDLLAW